MIRIGNGDRTAYKMLVDRHLRDFLAFAARIIGDRAEAEDVMQEAFVRVWKNAGKWDQGRKARFTTWFYRIVMNLCIDTQRRRKPASDIDAAAEMAAGGPLPDDQLSDRQKAGQVAEVMKMLPERQRLAMTLCYLQEQGNKEAAAILGVSIGALESLLVRGRARMAELLQDHRDELLKEKMR